MHNTHSVREHKANPSSEAVIPVQLLSVPSHTNRQAHGGETTPPRLQQILWAPLGCEEDDILLTLSWSEADDLLINTN